MKHKLNEFEPYEYERDNVDLVSVASLLRVLNRRWLSMLVTGAVLATLAWFCFQSVERLYGTNSVVLIEQASTELPEFTPGLPTIARDASSIETQVAILSSSTMAEEVVERLSLTENDEFMGVGNRESMFQMILNFGSNTQAKTNETPEEHQQKLKQRAIRRLMNARTVRRVGLSYLLSISIETTSPEMSKTIADAYAEVFIETQLDSKFQASLKTQEWLANRLAALAKEVELAESKVEDFRASAGLLETPGGGTLTERLVTDLNKQLTAARAELATAEARRASIQRRIRSGNDIASIREIQNSKLITELRLTDARLGSRIAEEGVNLGDQHPIMIELRSEQAEVRRRMAAEIDKLVDTIDYDTQILGERVTDLTRQLDQYNKELIGANRALVELRELERGATSTRELYETFLNRYKQANQRFGVEEADARLVASAPLPAKPSYPDNRVSVALSLFFGLAGALAIATILEFRDNTIRSVDQLKRLVGPFGTVLSPLPAVPRNVLNIDGKVHTPSEYVTMRMFSTFAESMRTIRAGMHIAVRGQTGKVIAVTSSVSDEGKTETCLSLARTMAISGARVLLIDCDLRRHSITEKIGLINSLGLTDLLRGSCDLDKAIHKDPLSVLDIMPIGLDRNMQQPLHAFQSLTESLEKFRSEYDAIFIDTAPLLAVADTLHQALEADEVLLLVRWAGTDRSFVTDAIQRLKTAKVRKIHAVLSMVSMRDIEMRYTRRSRDMRYYQN